jgi:hypothetical protein
MPKTKLLDEGSVRGQVAALEIRKQPAAGPDHLQQPAAAVMIFGVGAKMLGERIDPLGEQRYLYFGGSGVVFVGLMLSRYSLLVKAHAAWCPLNKVRVVIRCSTEV